MDSYATLNEILVKLFNDIMQIEEKAIITDEFKDISNNDMHIIEAIGKLNEKFAGEGRVLIRPSGTEPKVRVMIEGKDKKQIDAEAKKLAELIQNIML